MGWRFRRWQPITFSSTNLSMLVFFWPGPLDLVKSLLPIFLQRLIKYNRSFGN